MNQKMMQLLLCVTVVSAAGFTPYRFSNALSQAAVWETLAITSSSVPPRLFNATGTTNRNSYCLPSNPCWPSAAAWASLNMTLDGNLISILPEAASCTVPTSQDCSWVLGNWTDPYWRRMQPGAMQSPNWEADMVTGAACFNVGVPCEQGSIPSIGVVARSANDISAVLIFATLHNIRIVVKSSGHDYQGRSTAAGALAVWLHGMNLVSVDELFVACPGDTPRPTVTAQPGAGYGEVYELLSKAGKYAVVGGSARTVSAAGGHALAGGHSFMTPTYGLGEPVKFAAAADNIVSIDAVLSNGSLVTASACSNPDLFWALRGGGGSSFAVAVSMTHALHPVQAVVGLNLVVGLLDGVKSAAVWLDGFLYEMPNFYNASLSGGVWSGYSEILPTGNSQVPFVFAGSLVFTGSLLSAMASMAPLFTLIKDEPTLFYTINATFTPFTSFDAWHSSIDNQETGDRTGSWGSLGSRLLPMSICESDALRGNASIGIAQLSPLGVELYLVTPANTPDTGSVHTSVTPAWRSAALHVVFGLGWSSTATPADVMGNLTALTNLTQYLTAVLPGSTGAYWNEADYLQVDWQDTFWGAENYARLQGIKKDVDPVGVFSCHHCVELPAKSLPLSTSHKNLEPLQPGHL